LHAEICLEMRSRKSKVESRKSKVESRKSIGLIAIVLAVAACSGSSTPKPYGYYRLTLPTHDYTSVEQSAYKVRYATFNINRAAYVEPADSANADYFNIQYPSINSTIHCSYLPVHSNLPTLLKDAQEMVFSHAVKASAIPEQEYNDAEHHVHGVVYELQGNTATPVQFFLTDSTQHFFRASVYINTIPNQDSLSPVVDFLTDEVRAMVESFRWNQAK